MAIRCTIKKSTFAAQSLKPIQKTSGSEAHGSVDDNEFNSFFKCLKYRFNSEHPLEIIHLLTWQSYKLSLNTLIVLSYALTCSLNDKQVKYVFILKQ